MAIKGAGLAREFEFTPDSDPDKGTDRATVFTLRPLDSFLKARTLDKLTQYELNPDGSDAKTTLNLNEVAVETARFAITGWSNLLDQDTGREIEYDEVIVNVMGKPYPAVAPEKLRAIPLPVLKEVYDRVAQATLMTEEEAKNFGSGSSQSESTPSEGATSAPQTGKSGGDATPTAAQTVSGLTGQLSPPQR